MSQPRISVIIPNLNGGDYLERTLCSVLDQGYDNLEVWVADGGSTDHSLDILKHYEHELAGWFSSPDLGRADAINRALSKATGEIVGVLGSDDLYLPGALDAVARHMGGDGGADWIVGQCLRIGDRDQMLGQLTPSRPVSLAAYLMHDSGVLPLCSSFFRRSVVEAHRGFRTELPLAFDYEFTCRLLAAGEKPKILTATLTAKREHAPEPLRTLGKGLEYIEAARQNAGSLPMTQRYALWRNCDRRERIYALAQAELQGTHSREFLWQQLLRHPWWVVDESMRQRLVHGVGTLRPAA
jgi:glycosyltransferase involved in cell wall biosynthesis